MAPFHKTGHPQKGLCPLNMYGASALHKDFNGKKYENSSRLWHILSGCMTGFVHIGSWGKKGWK